MYTAAVKDQFICNHGGIEEDIFSFHLFLSHLQPLHWVSLYPPEQERRTQKIWSTIEQTNTYIQLYIQT